MSNSVSLPNTLNERVELKQYFPISARFVLRRNVSVIILAAVVIAVFSASFYALDFFGVSSAGELARLLLLKKLVVGIVLAVVMVARFAYDFLFFRTCNYYLERGRLHLETGVVIRQEGSVPISTLCEFYLEQRWVDFFLGTRDLIIKAAIGDGQEVCRLPALRTSTARGLQQYLISYSEIGREAPANLAEGVRRSA